MHVLDPHFAERFVGDLRHDLRVDGWTPTLPINGAMTSFYLVARNVGTGKLVPLEIHASKPVTEQELLDYAAKLIKRHTRKR